MLSFRLLITTGVTALLAVVPAFGASPTAGDAPPRVRGTIMAFDSGSITLKERDGRTITISTGPYTTYAEVVPSSLGEIKLNDFIGTASKGSLNDLIAVEIVIIPESMRAGRAGYAGWDPLPDTSGIRALRTTATSMSNGVVSSVSSVTPKLTHTTMTNGVISANGSNPAGRTLTVNLVDGKPVRITVSPTAPITRFVATDRSVVLVGSAVFIKTNPGSRAALVAVGKGITPPM